MFKLVCEAFPSCLGAVNARDLGAQASLRWSPRASQFTTRRGHYGYRLFNKHENAASDASLSKWPNNECVRKIEEL